MPVPSWKILLIGNAGSGDLSGLAEATADLVRDHDLRQATNAEAASRLAAEDWFPDLVLVLQSRPDEFARPDVETLLSVFPLARWVCCYGFWCESDGRNRDIWPPAIRIAARAAMPRIRRELQVLANQRAALPMTAGREEVFAFDCPGDITAVEPTPCRARVGVVTPDRVLRDWLCELLETAEFEALPVCADLEEADAVVWDADPFDEAMMERIRDFLSAGSQGRSGSVPVVALMNAAIVDERLALAELGVSPVIPKLASHELLLEALVSCLREPSAK